MDRTTPIDVRRALRREVGFGCPVPGCSNPYLEYHHFDPPWREREHHDPVGMVALCAEHHRKADGGAFTAAQLVALKRPTTEAAVGRFDWLRHDLLAVVGGNFYHETPVIFQFKGENAIWFERDAENHFLLNIRMLTNSGQRRLRLDNNDWIVQGEPTDFESPPSGRRIQAKYANGDELTVEFFELLSATTAHDRYPNAPHDMWTQLPFPITAVEVLERFGGSDFGFGPTWTKLGGLQMSGNFMSRCAVGLTLS